MTVSFHAFGNKNGGFAPDHVFLLVPSPTYAGLMALAGRVTWENVAVKVNDGWDSTADLQGGTGTGADAHTTRIHVDRRQLEGTELGQIIMQADTPASPTVEGHYGAMLAYSKGAGRWDVAASTGDDASHGANRSATGGALSLAPGDVVVAFAAVDTDTSLAGFASPAITAPGITFGTTTRRTSGGGTGQGNDGNIEVFDATVTAGTATAAPTLAFTTTTNQCGPVAFVRLRETTPVVSGWRPTTDQILDLVGVPRRFDDFRFDVVDWRNNRIGEVHPDLDKKPTVNWDTTRAVHRTLDGFYLPSDERNDLNVFTDRIRPYMVLQNGAEFSLGVFLYSDSHFPHRPWGTDREGTLLDKTYQLDQPRAFASSIPRHYPVLQWILDDLVHYPELAPRFEIEPGYGEDFEANVVRWLVAAMDEQGASKELGGPVTWSTGTHTLKMYNDVMDLVTYIPVHADRDGTLQFFNAAPLDSIVPRITDYTIANGRMIEESIVESDEGLGVPNFIFVYEAGPNGGFQWGRWHAPADAPYSEENRHFRVGRTFARSGLADWQEAEAVARHLSEWAIKAGSWIEWSGPADPRHDNYDVLQVEGKDGLQKRIEVSWKLPCVAGEPMTHRALRIYPTEATEVTG